MYDWILELGPGQRVLDVGAGAGSFPGLQVACTVIALDEDMAAFSTAEPLLPGYRRIFAQSGRMPFRAASIDLIVCHHSLEHVTGVEDTLAEIARVLKPGGRLFVSAPDGYSLCDGVYRFVFEGGGHVNRFHREQLIQMIENTVGVRLVRWQRLYSSFAYLWRLAEMMKDPPRDLSPRLQKITRLPCKLVTTTQHLLYSGTRLADRSFHTRLSTYGWALYFDHSAGSPVELPGYVNVCRFCGVGHPAEALGHPQNGVFLCTVCSRQTPYFPPSRSQL
jgi:hypothetical protein